MLLLSPEYFSEVCSVTEIEMLQEIDTEHVALPHMY